MDERDLIREIAFNVPAICVRCKKKIPLMRIDVGGYKKNKGWLVTVLCGDCDLPVRSWLNLEQPILEDALFRVLGDMTFVEALERREEGKIPEFYEDCLSELFPKIWLQSDDGPPPLHYRRTL